jgi:hypothetical protein
MAHFYGTLSGGKAKKENTTRTGNKGNGISSHVASWDKGIEVDVRYSEKDNSNVFTVYETGGSNNHSRKEVYSFTEKL